MSSTNDPNWPEGMISPVGFRAYLAIYPHREELREILAGTEEKPTQLAGGHYNPPNSPQQRVDLNSTEILYCEWQQGANFEEMSARDGRWQNIRLPSANLNRTDFTGTEWWQVYLNGSTLVKAKLTGARISYGTSHQTNMQGLSAIGSEWRGWHFGANLPPGDERNYTNLQGADFTNARFTNCTFHLCQLTRASFHNCIFISCTFDPYNLSQEIDFTGAKDLNGMSRFPDPADCLNRMRPKVFFQ